MEDLYNIIEGCKRKDPVCQERLYRHYYPALFTLCKTLFSEKHDIISALNNGMLRVFANIHQYNAEKGSFYGWMHVVVRNAVAVLYSEHCFINSQKINYEKNITL